jgi:hypothetical protein
MRDYVKMFDDCCGTCGRYCWDESPRTKGFRCSHHGDYCSPGEKKCYSYDRRPIDNWTIDRKMEEWDKYKRWYIVTEVCNLLGLPEDCEYRSLFATISERELMGTIDGEQLLADYDVYGPEVAWLLDNFARNENCKEAVNHLLKEELIPAFDKMVNDVRAGNVKKAILRYIVLTRNLMKKFNIPYLPVEVKYPGDGYSIMHEPLTRLKKTN